ncbi:class I SAM-dependent methyltransferase [Roseibium aggregatum]|uniref:Class I SAM-dependent methyltransferase n=1 Tax=Roseibium aggregatum TaxID=187304 RepID=A0A939EAB7_9HYPH|nr:class I SAM-dependent methyltransferase [Roseibium aggregatum]MBN9668749.1 class I SAM-dependent methyltransferase [Roseibium aggregatum]
MSGFSSHWLTLREPLDLAARNPDVEKAFWEGLPSGPVRLLDLASGAGSTVAALGKRADRPVDWLLTDHDPLLLDAARRRWGDAVSLRQSNLANGLTNLPFEEVDAITTSAFLDLVSERFLEELVTRIVRAKKPFLASLTYDGRTEFAPPHPFDDTLSLALNAHQRTDKGFGPALGPDAAPRAVALFEAEGYHVVQGASDWRAGPSSQEFQTEFLQGWANVGREVGLEKDALEDWWRDRREKIGDRRLDITVGHIDFAALPQHGNERA